MILAPISFHAMMATFTVASIQSAFVEIVKDLHVSVQRASYLTSLVISIIGGAQLPWKPFADRYGHQPIFLISLICSLNGNIGCAKSPTYATMGLSRALTAFFICPAAATGTAVVSGMFFRRYYARCMRAWALMATLGVPSAPFIFGFFVQPVGYRWIYWTLAIPWQPFQTCPYEQYEWLIHEVIGECSSADTLVLRLRGYSTVR